MIKRVLGLALCALFLALRASAEAQQEKLRIVGRIGSGLASAPISAANFEAFRQSLRELGWIEGKNLTIERGALGWHRPGSVRPPGGRTGSVAT